MAHRQELADQRLKQLEQLRQDNGLLQDQTADLHDQNEQIRTQLQVAVNRANELDVVLANVIDKNERLEKELQLERQRLQDPPIPLPGPDDVQTQQLLDQLTRELRAKDDDNAALRTTNDRLQRQLQAEKSENTGRLGWTQEKWRSRDQDDEEVLPKVHKAHGAPFDVDGQSIRVGPRFPPSYGSPKPPPILSAPFARKTSTPSTVAEQQPTPTTTSKKRRRNEREELDEELENLGLDDFDITPAQGLRPRRKKKQRPTSPALYDDGFAFQAVVRYDDQEETISIQPPEDIEACLFLVERIKRTKEIWEANKGAAWAFDFTRKDYKPATPHCVSRRTAGRRTKWRAGGEGRYACRDCVGRGRPCFAWVEKEGLLGEEIWEAPREFRLLPLHEGDRTHAVVEGRTEVRFWLNDHTAFSDGDVRKGGEEEDDYVD